MRKLLLLAALVGAALVLAAGHAPVAKAQCVNGPAVLAPAAQIQGPNATCGGYPEPPVCYSANSGAAWFGHWWALSYYNPSGPLIYTQTTFTCGYNPALEIKTYNQTGDARAVYPYAWGGLAYQ